jgi:hypothetical protein
LDDLAAILDVSRERIDAALRPLGFVIMTDCGTGDIGFVSESFRKFAAIQLADWRQLVNNRIIDSLMKHPHSPDSLTKLPGYLQIAGRNEQLVSYLTPDHFIAMLEQSQSLGPVHQHARVGLSAALKLKDDSEILRFGIQESAINGLDSISISRAEVRARVALGEYDSALALAQSATLKQDKLRLLAALARARKQRGLQPENELVEQILELLKEIDVRDLGENAIDLAIDLMYFKPDAAFKVVDRMTRTPDSRSVDFALARLSIAGAVAREHEQVKARQASDDARQKIKDPELFKLSTAVALMMGEYSAHEIISQAEKLINPIDRIYLLRQWALHTTDYELAPEVVEYAFKLAIRTAEYTPSATHVRELATPLPFISRIIPLQRIIGLIDSQKVRTEELGPTQDYVRLQVVLAEAESKFNCAAAGSRLVDAYLNI